MGPAIDNSDIDRLELSIFDVCWLRDRWGGEALERSPHTGLYCYRH